MAFKVGDLVELVVGVDPWGAAKDRFFVCRLVPADSIYPDRIGLGDSKNDYKFWVYEHEIKLIETEPKPDPVNSPSHYVYKGFEVVDVLNEAFPDDPHSWNAGKYLLRAKRKGNEAQDLRKAIRMIEYRLAVLENGD